MSIDRGINKMCYIYTIAYISNRVYISHQKSEITPLAATWRDLDIVVLSALLFNRVSEDLVRAVGPVKEIKGI